MGNLIKAVIFDMDGVISDTQVLHSKTEEAILNDYGISISADEVTRRFAGSTDKEMFRTIFADYKKEPANLEEMVEKKWRTITDFAKGNVREVPGTREFIDKLHSKGFKLAVASASRKTFIDLVLNELKINSKFHVIASSEEVAKGKPDPAVFLLAAERLRVLPEECVVIEDGLNGMTAAKRAGMRCIGLTTTHGERHEYPADILVKNLLDVPMEFFL